MMSQRPMRRIVVRAVLLAVHLALPIGAAQAGFDGSVLGYQEKQIYHSPWGYSSWVGLWKMPGGAIQCDFTQITGPTDDPYWNAPVYQSTNSGASWSLADPDLPKTHARSNPRYPGYYQAAPSARRGMWVSADGKTMVRSAWGTPDVNGVVYGYTRRSTDGGDSWSNPIQLPAGRYGSFKGLYPTLIKPVTLGNGNQALALIAGACPSGYSGANGPNASLLKTMFLSVDQGLTWSNPIEVMPQSAGVSEESDFVQLANGDLMWIHRAEHWAADGLSMNGTTRMKSIMKLEGNTFVAQPAVEMPFPHSGFPCELMTREGIILDLCTTGSHWSNDNGNTWHDLLVDGRPLSTYYYPQAVQANDGTIVVVGHNGSDDPYGEVDQAVMLQTFRLPATVPEPSALVSMTAGALGLSAYAWRRGRCSNLRRRGASLPGNIPIMNRRIRILLTVLLLTACVPSQRAAATQESRPVIICRNAGAGGYQAFPDVCRLKDGRLMCAFYASYHHIGLPCPEHPQGGRIACCVSTDEGHSWSKPETLYDGPDDDRDPSIVQLKDGRLVCNFFTLHRTVDSKKPCPDPFKEAYTLSGTWTVVSSDGGKTWGDARKICDGYFCSSPIRELTDGKWLMPLYAETLTGNGSAFGAMGASCDGGATWRKPVDIDNAGIRLDAETDVIELAGGRLWAIQRSSGSPACFSVSDNRGDTWTRSQPLSFVAHSPYLLRVKPDNMVVLGYRGYHTIKGSSAGFTALRCSRDECKTWGDAIVVDDVVGAYPSMVQLQDGSVLIVYYDEGCPSSIRAKRFRITPAGITWLAP